LVGRPRYYLQAWPRGEVEVDGILRAGPDALRQIISHPKEVREFGFGLRTGVLPSPLPGGGLRVATDRLSLSLERNGLMTLVAAADRAYLAWADEQRGSKNGLHPMALIECTLEFVRLFEFEVLPRCRPPVDEWEVAGGMSDLHTGDHRTSLHPGPHQQLISDLWMKPVLRSRFELGPYVVRKETPGLVTYRILRDIYPEFGIDESEIPYVTDGTVDEEKIRAVGSR
jgi:hypothetical protein